MTNKIENNENQQNEKRLHIHDIGERSEPLLCDTCIWKDRTYVKCGDCNNYDKYESATNGW